MYNLKINTGNRYKVSIRSVNLKKKNKMQVKECYNFILWNDGVKVRSVHDKEMFLIDSKFLGMDVDLSQNSK